MVQQLVDLGARVVACSRNQSDLDALAAATPGAREATMQRLLDDIFAKSSPKDTEQHAKTW